MLLVTGTLLCLQYNKEDFMKKGKRILAAFLAVLMVVAIMPFTSFSGIFTGKGCREWQEVHF